MNVEPGTTDWLWMNGKVLPVEPLLRELLKGMLHDGHDYEPGSRTALAVPFLLKMLEEAPALGEEGLPLPHDAKLLAICEHMMTEPATDYTLDRWADEIGTSGRTLARHFKEETGMSFGHVLA